MKVSSVQDLYNQIEKYIRTHGRLVFGATVLLCLIFYLVWRESTWAEVEHLESPMQTHAKQEAKRATAREGMSDVTVEENKDTTVEGQGQKKMKKNGDSRYKGKTRGDNKARSSQDTPTESALRYSVRSVIRAYPLVDSFSKEVVPMPVKETKETIEETGRKKGDSIEGAVRTSHRHRVHRGRNDYGDGPTVKEGRRVPLAPPVRIVLQGTVVGDTSMAVLSISGTSYVLGEGESAEQVTIESIQEHRVLIRYKGESRWIE